MTNFSNFNNVKEKIRFLPVEVNWTDITPGQDVTAFTYYDKEKYCHVVVTPKLQCLFMHECGHIIFGHNNYSEQATELAKKLFREKFKNIVESIKSEKIIPEEATLQYILNVAMDMEVNSRLFTMEEQELLGQTIANVFKRKNRPILPKDFGYPEKMNYIYYLSKMVQDNNVIRKLAEYELNSHKSAELMKNQINNANDRKTISTSHGKYHPISTPAIVQAVKKAIEKAAKEKKMSDGSSLVHVKTKSKKKVLENKLSSSLNSEPEFSKITGKKFSSLKEAFSFLFPQFVKTPRNDLLYNYNRRKHGNTGIIIGKRVENLTPRLPSVYILMDCSYSMDKKILNDISSTLKGIKLNSKSKVIFWDENKCGEIAYRNIKKLEEFPHGGGTDLASGIRYINSFKRKEDTLVVISDFYDDLKEIRNAVFESANTKHLLIGCNYANKDLLNFREFNIYISNDGEM